jgi:O-antigen/teichoic acid export membrane protein
MNAIFALSKIVTGQLEGRPTLQKILNNTGWLFAERILRMVVGLFVGSWVTRYLGPEQFGLYAYTVSFVALFIPIAGLGLDNIVIREVVRDSSRRDELLGTAFFLKLGSGVLVLLATIGGIFLLHPQDSRVLWLTGIIATGMITRSLDVIDFLFRSHVQAQHAVCWRSAAFVVISLVKIGLVLTSADLMAFAWASLVEMTLGAVGLCMAYRMSGYTLSSWRWSGLCAKDLLRDSWPFVFSGVLIMVYMRIDQMMLNDMVGPGAVGIYAAAVQLAEVWYIIPTAIVSSALPAIIEAKAISEALFYARLQKIYRSMAFLGYLVAIPVSLFANDVIALLYGDAFSDAGPMLALLIWAGIFTNLGVARSSFLTTMNWTKIHLVVTLMGGIINVGLNLVLIPKYHGLGAVMASIAAYSFQAYFSCFFCRPLFKTGLMLSKALIFPNPFTREQVAR